MLRKAKQIFSRKRNIRGEMVELSGEGINQHDPVAVFKDSFERSFAVFIAEAELFAKGNTHIDDTWIDILGKEGLGVSVAVTAGIVSILGAVGIMTAVASAGTAIPVAVAGILIGIAFYAYRNHVKLERFQRAAEKLERPDIENEIREIANLLTDLYRLQLSTCTLKDAHLFGKECVEVLVNEMLMNKKFNFDELLYPASLQALYLRNLSKVSKHRMDMNINTERKFNMRGMMGHAAYYCRENDKFYQTAHSKPKKYGVLQFETKRELRDFEEILTREMPENQDWRLHHIREHDVNLLLRSSIFKAAQNDNVFQPDVEFITNAPK